jgi:uncharacterized protein (TIGR00255 family)
MTGFGEAHLQEAGTAVAVEVRAINSRYFKMTLRAQEGYSLLEPQIEAQVREQVKRGTVQVSLQVDRLTTPDDYWLNLQVLMAYRRQLEEAGLRGIGVEHLLPLPGVVHEGRLSPSRAEEDWPLVSRALAAALEHLSAMRQREGQTMAVDLRANCRAIAAELDKIAARAPLTVDAFRARLEERVRRVLEEHDIQLNPSDLIREVAVYAERSDISEEIVRLRSHLEQYEAIMNLPESSGRKLDFLTQEMHREVNTIGSKSGDVEIARCVIEIKTAIERLREMIQNVE